MSNLYHDIFSMVLSVMKKNEFVLLKYIEILDNNIALYNYNELLLLIFSHYFFLFYNLLKIQLLKKV